MTLPPGDFIPTRTRGVWVHAARGSLLAGTLFIVVSFAAGRRTERVSLLPKLHPGQTLSYHVSYHSDKLVQADSPAVSQSAPADAEIDVHALLRLEILDLQPHANGSAVHACTRFEVLDSGVPARPPQILADDPHAKAVEFTLLPDGRFDDVKGLDALVPEQQQAWREWASRFALAAIFPNNGARIAEKVKSEEAEPSPSPIAGLRWARESTYVRDEPCGAVLLTVHGDLVPADSAADTCAVVVTTATLKQQSSPRDSTPESFKVRDLRTDGTARGKNRIITYISRKTGLVVRAIEEANQSMNVTVAKTDGTNHVHYSVAAKSRSEVLLVSETSPAYP